VSTRDETKREANRFSFRNPLELAGIRPVRELSRAGGVCRGAALDRTRGVWPHWLDPTTSWQGEFAGGEERGEMSAAGPNGGAVLHNDLLKATPRGP